MSLFAVVPAAGLSRRMGQPKLVMDLAGKPVVAWLLDALDQPQIDSIVVVVRKSDELLQSTIRAQNRSVELVLPDTDPPDMRASVEHALERISTKFAPSSDDGWLLIPADHPVLDRELVGSLLETWRHGDADILLPVANGRRGHPVIMRWSMTELVQSLPEGTGLNALKKLPGVNVQETPVADDSIVLDVDTPEDFARLKRRLGESRDDD